MDPTAVFINDLAKFRRSFETYKTDRLKESSEMKDLEIKYLHQQLSYAQGTLAEVAFRCRNASEELSALLASINPPPPRGSEPSAGPGTSGAPPSSGSGPSGAPPSSGSGPTGAPRTSGGSGPSQTSTFTGTNPTSTGAPRTSGGPGPSQTSTFTGSTNPVTSIGVTFSSTSGQTSTFIGINNASTSLGVTSSTPCPILNAEIGGSGGWSDSEAVSDEGDDYQRLTQRYMPLRTGNFSIPRTSLGVTSSTPCPILNAEIEGGLTGFVNTLMSSTSTRMPSTSYGDGGSGGLSGLEAVRDEVDKSVRTGNFSIPTTSRGEWVKMATGFGIPKTSPLGASTSAYVNSSTRPVFTTSVVVTYSTSADVNPSTLPTNQLFFITPVPGSGGLGDFEAERDEGDKSREEQRISFNALAIVPYDATRLSFPEFLEASYSGFIAPGSGLGASSAPSVSGSLESLSLEKDKDVSIGPFQALTEDDRKLVANAFSEASRTQVLVTHENSYLKITGEILRCLRPEKWLNDEVVNFYFMLLKERERREPKKFLKCHFFSTFFYNKLWRWTKLTGYDYLSVRKWTSKGKLGYTLYECDKIFVPVHKEEQQHWCLAVINIKEKIFQYLDSFGGGDENVMGVLKQYIVDEVKDKNAEDIDVTSWKEEFVRDLPEQKNGFDCGLFMIKYADFYSRDIGLCFNQEDMPYFRLRTAKEILKQIAN